MSYIFWKKSFALSLICIRFRLTCKKGAPDPDPLIRGTRIRGSGFRSVPKCHGSATLRPTYLFEEVHFEWVVVAAGEGAVHPHKNDIAAESLRIFRTLGNNLVIKIYKIKLAKNKTNSSLSEINARCLVARKNGLAQGVRKRCRLSWLTNSPVVHIWAQMRGEGWEMRGS